MVPYDFDLDCDPSSRLSSEDVMTVAQHVSAGLLHLLSLGIVHHDAKPGNTLCKDGVYVLADFESVCVPFYDPKNAGCKREYSLEMPAELDKLSWGPYDTESPDHEGRWMYNWDYYKGTNQFQPPNVDSFHVWPIDSFAWERPWNRSFNTS